MTEVDTAVVLSFTRPQLNQKKKKKKYLNQEAFADNQLLKFYSFSFHLWFHDNYSSE